MNQADALKSIARLEELVKHFGGLSPEHEREFKRLIYSLRTGPLQDPYFREKLSDAEDQANDGFSVQKFETRPGCLQQVKVWALGSLSTAGTLIEQNWPTV